MVVEWWWCLPGVTTGICLLLGDKCLIEEFQHETPFNGIPGLRYDWNYRVRGRIQTTDFVRDDKYLNNDKPDDRMPPGSAPALLMTIKTVLHCSALLT